VAHWDTPLLPVVVRNPRILPVSQVQVPDESFKATMAFFTATDLEMSRNSVCNTQCISCESLADRFEPTSALLAAITTYTPLANPRSICSWYLHPTSSNGQLWEVKNCVPCSKTL